MHFLTILLDWLFPPHPFTTEAAHVSEETALQLMSPTFHEKTHVYTALPYSNPHVRAIIKANKFYNHAHSARLLGSVLNEMLLSFQEEHMLDPLWHQCLLIPMPSAPRTKNARGYNQVERLLNTVPKETRTHFTVSKDVLARHARKSQTHVPRTARASNIANAFYVPTDTTVYGSVCGKHILLIDDVSETGSTMADAMRALYEAGAQSVIGIALAR